MPVTPDYVRIAREIENSIRSGDRQPHSKLPSLSELREAYSVSESTVKFALAWVEARGLIYRHQGKGIFVSDPTEWWTAPPGHTAE